MERNNRTELQFYVDISNSHMPRGWLCERATQWQLELLLLLLIESDNLQIATEAQNCKAAKIE